jgi:hypothetical protein
MNNVLPEAKSVNWHRSRRKGQSVVHRRINDTACRERLRWIFSAKEILIELADSHSGLRFTNRTHRHQQRHINRLCTGTAVTWRGSRGDTRPNNKILMRLIIFQKMARPPA